MNPLSDPLPITHDLLILATAPDEPVADALATELQRLGWETVTTEDVGPYAYDARGCVVLLLTPESPHSRAARSALAERPANMIPVVHPEVSPPYGRWSSGPIPYTGSTAATANAINDALQALLQGTGKSAAVTGYVPGGSPTAPPPLVAPASPIAPTPPITPAPPLVSTITPPLPVPKLYPTYPPPQPGPTILPSMAAQPAYPGMQPIATDALEFALPTEAPQDTSKLALYALVAGVALLACVLLGLLTLYLSRPSHSAAVPLPHAASAPVVAAGAISEGFVSYLLAPDAQPT